MFTFSFTELAGIGLSAIASIVIGGLWYSPLLFGLAWMREVGLTEERMKASALTPLKAVSLAVILDVSFAVFVNVLFSWIGVRTVGQGALLGALCCVTFYCIPLLVHSVFDASSKKAWAIHASHELLLSALIGAIVSWSITA